MANNTLKKTLENSCLLFWTFRLKFFFWLFFNLLWSINFSVKSAFSCLGTSCNLSLDFVRSNNFQFNLVWLNYSWTFFHKLKYAMTFSAPSSFSTKFDFFQSSDRKNSLLPFFYLRIAQFLAVYSQSPVKKVVLFLPYSVAWLGTLSHTATKLIFLLFFHWKIFFWQTWKEKKYSLYYAIFGRWVLWKKVVEFEIRQKMELEKKVSTFFWQVWGPLGQFFGGSGPPGLRQYPKFKCNINIFLEFH